MLKKYLLSFMKNKQFKELLAVILGMIKGMCGLIIGIATIILFNFIFISPAHAGIYALTHHSHAN